MPLPKPHKNEKEPEFISRCVSFVKGERPNMDNKQAVAMCYNQWREKESVNMDWQKLKFDVSISEMMGNNDMSPNKDDLMIEGIAINETTTRNGITYMAEELEPAAYTLKNKPILKDHENKVDNIVGFTTENVMFNSEKKAVVFQGIIKDKKAQDMIKQGLIKSVSIGATVRDIEEYTKEGSTDRMMVARGIQFVELSLVAVPADPNANFVMAIAESYKLKSDVKIKNMEEEKMVEEIAKEKSRLELLKEEAQKLEEDVTVLKIEKMKAEKDKLSVKEEPKVEVKEEIKVENKTKGIVEDIKPEDENYIFENVGGKVSMTLKNYKGKRF